MTNTMRGCPVLSFPGNSSVVRRVVVLTGLGLLAVSLHITGRLLMALQTVPRGTPRAPWHRVGPNEGQQGQCFLGKYCIKYQILTKGLCATGAEVQLFMFIFSLPYNINKRQMIRETWLNRTVLGNRRIEYLFIVGHQDLLQDNRLQVEANAYNDIMVINISESFYKLTLKALAGLHVAINHCPRAKYVMKTDDDIFINTFLLQNIINMLIATMKTDKVLMGHVWYNGMVFRHGKYAVTKEQYPWNHFPPFCSGSGYIMSMDVSTMLFDEAMQDNSSVMLHLDDPYITGILANRARLTHYNMQSLYRISDSDVLRVNLQDIQVKRLLVLHLSDANVNKGSTLYQFYLSLWRKVVSTYGKQKHLV